MPRITGIGHTGGQTPEPDAPNPAPQGRAGAGPSRNPALAALGRAPVLGRGETSAANRPERRTVQARPPSTVDRQIAALEAAGVDLQRVVRAVGQMINGAPLPRDIRDALQAVGVSTQLPDNLHQGRGDWPVLNLTAGISRLLRYGPPISADVQWQIEHLLRRDLDIEFVAQELERFLRHGTEMEPRVRRALERAGLEVQLPGQPARLTPGNPLQALIQGIRARQRLLNAPPRAGHRAAPEARPAERTAHAPGLETPRPLRTPPTPARGARTPEHAPRTPERTSAAPDLQTLGVPAAAVRQRAPSLLQRLGFRTGSATAAGPSNASTSQPARDMFPYSRAERSRLEDWVVGRLRESGVDLGSMREALLAYLSSGSVISLPPEHAQALASIGVPLDLASNRDTMVYHPLLGLLNRLGRLETAAANPPPRSEPLPPRDQGETRLQYAARLHRLHPSLTESELKEACYAQHLPFTAAERAGFRALTMSETRTEAAYNKLKPMTPNAAAKQGFKDGETDCMFGETLSFSNPQQKIVALSSQPAREGGEPSVCFVDLNMLDNYVLANGKHPLTNKPVDLSTLPNYLQRVLPAPPET